MGSTGRASGMDWSVCAAPLAGEVDSADRHVVAAWKGQVLPAVIDGLGHGAPAAAAATTAVDVLAAWRGPALEELDRPEENTRRIFERCRKTSVDALVLVASHQGRAA